MLMQRFLGDPGEEVCVVLRWRGPGAPTAVICPGLAVGAAEPRYLLPILARELHELGWNTFQFDYLGDGDSAGDHSRVTLGTATASTERVVAFAESLGCGGFALVGYGVGNVVTACLAARERVRAVALIAPHLPVFNGGNGPVWEALDRLDTSGGAVFPQSSHADGPLGALLRATVGEAVVPAQPCGPISPGFLQELRTVRPQEWLARSSTPLLVVSDNSGDALARPAAPAAFRPIDHTPSGYRPSWHWCAECREGVLGALREWLREHLPAPAPREPGLSPRPPPPPLPDGAGEDFRPGERVRACSFAREVRGETVLGVLHVPPRGAPHRPVGLVYEVGIPGQRVDVHRCGPRTAAALAGLGFYVLRYDARGMGLSDGDFSEVTWTRKLEDLRQVMDAVSALGPDRFVVLGNSAGARMAYLAANRCDRVAGCVSWGPILVEPEERVGEGVLRRHPSGRLVTEYCGLWLGVAYNLDERRYDFLDEFRRCRKPGLVLFAREEENRVNKERMREIAREMPGTVVREVPGTHGFAPEAVPEVIGATTEWLVELAAGLDGAPVGG
ncbi:MAG TPA: alpha/beta hydrolase [Longimicrobiaceae bacterium]|nr:alpha/beta hydrolase [Longimicrobiaceae bacterium]